MLFIWHLAQSFENENNLACGQTLSEGDNITQLKEKVTCKACREVIEWYAKNPTPHDPDANFRRVLP